MNDKHLKPTEYGDSKAVSFNFLKLSKKSR